MRIWLVMTARDEESIIGHSVVYHLAQGVERVLVRERWSCDGTADVLRDLARTGAVESLEWSEQPDPLVRDQAGAMTHMARRAWEAGADWVIAADADEFWSHPKGLPFVFQWADRVGLDVIRFPVCEYAPPMTRRVLGATTIWGDHRNWRGLRSTPKIAFRASPNAEILHGNREVMTPGKIGEVQGAEILHLPFVTPEQMREKCQLRCDVKITYSRENYLRPFRDAAKSPEETFQRLVAQAEREGRHDRRLVECLQGQLVAA